MELDLSYSPLSLVDLPERHPVSLFSNYWFDCKGDGFVPLRHSIEPTRIPAILPWVMLLERVGEDGALEFRHRLFGTGCRDLAGADYTGRLIGEGFTPEAAAERKRELRLVCATGEPLYMGNSMPLAERDFIKVYRGVFPVTLTGDRIDQVFVVMAQEDLRLDVRKTDRMAGSPLKVLGISST